MVKLIRWRVVMSDFEDRLVLTLVLFWGVAGPVVWVGDLTLGPWRVAGNG